jgi:hypothetical protein
MIGTCVDGIRRCAVKQPGAVAEEVFGCPSSFGAVQCIVATLFRELMAVKICNYQIEFSFQHHGAA